MTVSVPTGGVENWRRALGIEPRTRAGALPMDQKLGSQALAIRVKALGINRASFRLKGNDAFVRNRGVPPKPPVAAREWVLQRRVVKEDVVDPGAIAQRGGDVRSIPVAKTLKHLPHVLQSVIVDVAVAPRTELRPAQYDPSAVMRMQVAHEHLLMVPGKVLTDFHRNDPVPTWERKGKREVGI